MHLLGVVIMMFFVACYVSSGLACYQQGHTQSVASGLKD